jgi:hypothetical protein
MSVTIRVHKLYQNESRSAAAEALREVSSVPFSQHRRSMNEHPITALLAQLSEEVFATAWAQGRNMRHDKVIAALQRAEMPLQVFPPKPTE